MHLERHPDRVVAEPGRVALVERRVLGRVVAIVARDVVPEGRDRLELVELEERQVARVCSFRAPSLIVLAVSARYFALLGRGMIRIKPVVWNRSPLYAL